jgi:hypothetical protein
MTVALRDALPEVFAKIEAAAVMYRAGFEREHGRCERPN